MSPDKKIGDAVYYIQDYKVIKCTIEAVINKTDKTGTKKTYVLQTWKNGDNKQKTFNCIEAQMVDSLSVAKQSALENWERIIKQVKQSLDNLTDKDFGE